MLQELTDEQRKIVDKVAKILKLADRNPNPEEAASAANKAQKMLEDYNLTASMLEQASGDTGAREMQMILGGAHEFQRSLWRTVCDLNFCMYISRQKWESKGRTHRSTRKWYHQVVGRVVNVRSAYALGSYLEQAVERVLIERLPKSELQAHSPLHTNWAYSFREGAFDSIISKLVDQRNARIAEELAAKDAMTADASTATALTLGGLTEREQDANLDFIHGEGYTARKKADRARRAAAEAEAEAAHAAWCAANPEEAAKAAETERKENEKYWARRRGGSYGRSTVDTKNHGAYRSGREAGKSISIHKQSEGTRVSGRIGTGARSERLS